MTTQNFHFQAAEQLVAKKEKLLEQLFDLFFEGDPWDEDTIEQHARIDILPDGTEVFSICAIPLIKFHPIQCNYVVEDQKMSITLDQPYEVVFEAGK